MFQHMVWEVPAFRACHAASHVSRWMVLAFFSAQAVEPRSKWADVDSAAPEAQGRLLGRVLVPSSRMYSCAFGSPARHWDGQTLTTGPHSGRRCWTGPPTCALCAPPPARRQGCQDDTQRCHRGTRSSRYTLATLKQIRGRAHTACFLGPGDGNTAYIEHPSAAQRTWHF